MKIIFKKRSMARESKRVQRVSEIFKRKITKRNKLTTQKTNENTDLDCMQLKLQSACNHAFR
jgi:hypothetical protein